MLKNWTGSVVVCLLAFGATIVAPVEGLCEVVEIEIPIISDFDNYSIDIDLGGPVEKISSIRFRAGGEAEIGEYICWATGYPVPDCTEADDVWMDFRVIVFTPSGLQGATYNSIFRVKEGFSFDREMVHRAEFDQLFIDGTGRVSIHEDSLSQLYHSRCWDGGFNVKECSSGSLVFSEFPVVVIEFDLLVSAHQSSWGALKSVYR